ncbi:NAD(P)-binding Rossmann-fold superfamily protein [Klebsormidium nitens]|uniref:NAD(P)-binding Rossmann-fold superfamily protein n=1 Tax=Klebsormidium nitens TaxID=105231 RepID=A0A1Y1HPA5_KLENI|nr:NAD(P)-binding Rossmann-fold superfamily protein [Klebsormidium nitens]|eukprot:GAQ79612.1 NAD(P)-binding Rossmann-fold superfamily protein [Klebsormidium nitens]
MAVETGVLILGSTGYIGKFVALAAAAESGVKAYALVSKATQAKPERAEVLQKLRSAGIQFLEGDINDHASLVAALKRVTVVISCVGFSAHNDQPKILEAAKEAGTITRFLPSDFAFALSKETIAAFGDVHPRFTLKEPTAEAANKSGIPYTFIWANLFGAYAEMALGRQMPMQNDEIDVYGTDKKIVAVDEGDIGRYTIKAALDPRAANKTVRLEPPRNAVTQSELIALCEKLRGKTYKKRDATAEMLVEEYKNSNEEVSFFACLRYAFWISGDHTQPKREGDLSTAELYPDLEYKSIEAILRP